MAQQLIYFFLLLPIIFNADVVYKKLDKLDFFRRPLRRLIGIYNNTQITRNISFLLHHSLSSCISNHCKLTYKLSGKLEFIL